MRKTIAEQLEELGIVSPSTLAGLVRDFPVFKPLKRLRMPPESGVSFREHPVIETWVDDSGLPLGDRWLLRANINTGQSELIEVRPEHENLPPGEVGKDFGPATHLVVVTKYDENAYCVCVWTQ